IEVLDGCYQDVMQVCRNGHVITDLLHTYPERALSHCERCGAESLYACETCGTELAGAVFVPGLVPIGRLEAPQYCATCGAAFPWAHRRRRRLRRPLVVLEPLLRRLPLAARQLRIRQGERPPFRVEEERDLEDLLRALLPLQFDGIRPESRTPSYSPVTRMDFLLDSGACALTAKLIVPGVSERDLATQLEEDVTYYERRPGCRTLVGFVYDPEALLRDPGLFETEWSKPQNELELRCVIAS